MPDENTQKKDHSGHIPSPGFPVDGIPLPDLDLTTQISHAAVLCLNRFKITGSLLHLQAALLFAEEAVQSTPAVHPAITIRLSNLGTMLQTKYAWTRRATDLDHAINVLTRALETAPAGDIDLASKLCNLSSALGKRFEQKKGTPDLEEAIRKAREAVTVSAARETPVHGMSLSVLGDLLEKRYVHLQNAPDLEEALRVTTQAVKAIRPGNFDLPASLIQLSRLFQRRFGLMKEIQDLEQSDCTAQRALRAVPRGHPGLPVVLNQLSTVFQEMTKLSEATIDLKGNISTLERAMIAINPISSTIAPTLRNLARMLEDQYQRTRNFGNLEKGISKMRQAVKIMLKNESDRVPALHYLAHLLEAAFHHTEVTDHLDQAIQCLKQALGLIPAARRDAIPVLSAMVKTLHLRFEKLESIADINEAIAKAEQVVRATPAEAELVMPLTNLGCCFESRFVRKGNFEDLEKAIKYLKKALDLIKGHQHSDHAAILSNLGSMLGNRFTRTRESKDIEEAIAQTHEAVIETLPDDPKLGQRLNALGKLLVRRYMSSGREEHLEEAILQFERSVELPEPSNTAKAFMLGNMGGALKERYLRSGRLQDLEEAIKRTQQGIETLPTIHSAKAGMLHSLASMFTMQFLRTSDMRDLDSAADTATQAVAATMKDHADLVHIQNNLGSILKTRFEHLGHRKDLDKAISILEKTQQDVPSGHLGQAMVLYNLGSSLERLFLLTKNQEDLEKAIAVTEEAIEKTATESSQLAESLNLLGSLYGLSPSSTDMERSLDSFLRSWNCLNGRLPVRVSSARHAIHLLEKQEDWSRAHSLAEQALALVPNVSSRLMSREDKEHAIKNFAGLASHACSLALQVGADATRALELAELGRGVIVGSLIEDRSDISKLQQSYPEKALEYENIRRELNRPDIDTSGLISPQDTKQRKELIQAIEVCAEYIRNLTGFERFLLGPTSTEMMDMASEGHLVMVNITQFRSDAIIISSTSVRVVQLHALDFKGVETWMTKDLTRISSLKERFEKNKAYRNFLVWLWSVCVEPVLGAVGIVAESSPGNAPRIWWMGVGIAGFLPFHAAGDHSLGSTNSTLSRAISSYTPTIRALKYSREGARFGSQKGKPKMLVVTMPITPGIAKDLPGSEKEGAQIRLVCESEFSVELKSLPSAEFVLNSLIDYDIAHFACHGLSDALDPSNSCLLLGKSCSSDLSETPDKLTVRQISQTKLERPKIAFLSACSTAENKSVILSDEVIHIASGFQVAGFRHTVGCMWPSDDEVSVEVAKLFYEQLVARHQVLDQDPDRMIATALHHSLIQIRERWRKLPLAWAQYLHLGA